MINNKNVVTRVAPSPTSPYGLHIGNIRTALFNYMFAKQNGGTFYVRIEDTDQDRFCEGSEELIKKTLDWLGIKPDFAPWTDEQPYGAMRQSERDYSKHIQYLLDNGYAYYAFDTKEELDSIRANDQNFSYNHSNRMNMRNSLSLPKEEVERLLSINTPYTIRFKVTPEQTITFNDIIRDEVTFNSSQMDDKVLVKTNGIPTYHLANCCDDHDMGTTHTLRGEEWLSSTPLHIMLYNAFNWEAPNFGHLPLVLNPAPLKGKLSKRNAVKLGIPIFPFGGESSDGYLTGFVDQGYESEAVINFLMLLGWTPHEHKEDEIMSLQEGIEKFDLYSVHKAPARYDIDKLKYFNAWYLHNKNSNEELLKYVDFSNSNFNMDKKLSIIDMAKKRSHFKSEMQNIVNLFINEVNMDEKSIEITPYHNTALYYFMMLSDDIEWTADNIKEILYKSCEKINIKLGKIMPIIRNILVGGAPGPDMVSFMSIIGKEETIKRIKKIITYSEIDS